MTVPYKTSKPFADAQVFRDKLENGWLGIGGVILVMWQEAAVYAVIKCTVH